MQAIELELAAALAIELAAAGMRGIELLAAIRLRGVSLDSAMLAARDAVRAGLVAA